MSVLPALLLALTAAAPAPGSEIVVILDNSGSMAQEWQFSVNGVSSTVPPSDPERLAVLGALVVDALDEGSDDKVTVIGFGKTETATPPSTVTHADIRSWPYHPTLFRKPLEQAKGIFEASDRKTKVLIFFTDGTPNDIADVAEMKTVFDPEEHPDVDVIAVGLFGDERIAEIGSLMLRALVHDPSEGSGDFVEVDNPREIVGAFTNGYARAIGSRAETLTLTQGKKHEIQVGKYVSEVIVVAVSGKPGRAFSAQLTGPDGAVSVLGEGDNGCPIHIAGAEICGGARRHYQVFRSDNDPASRSEWTLSIPSSDTKVEVGVILRYDLLADLIVEGPVASGTTVPLEARLLFRGQPFDDEVFFSADNFQARVEVDGETIPLTHAGGGTFRADWAPAVREADEAVIVEAVFENDWMRKSDMVTVVVKPPPYVLVLDQDALSLEPIPARWSRDELCVTVDLSGSKDIEDVELECSVSDWPLGVRFTCERTDPHTLAVCGSTHHWCCGKDGQVQVLVKGPGTATPRTSATLPTTYQVEGAGFIRCHWLIWATIAAVIFLLWFIYGWIKPHNFEATVAVTVAGSQAGLRRAGEQILRELPGGKSGFYRNAKLCLNGAGDVLRKPPKAAMVLEAGPGGHTVFRKAAGLEYRDRRTRKWKTLQPDELGDGYNAGVIYRLGDLYVKFTG